MTSPFRARCAAGCAALLVLALAFWRLDDVGPSFELARGEFAYADALLEWTLEGDAAYLDVGWRPRRLPMRDPAPRFEPAMPIAAISVPASIAAGASQRWFWSEWGLIDSVGALRLPALLAAAVIAALAVFIATRHAGWLGGLAALVTLFACPRFVGHAAFDVRHVPATAWMLLFWTIFLEWRSPPASRIIVEHAPRLSEAARRRLCVVVLGVVLGCAVAWRTASVSMLVAWPLVALIAWRRLHVGAYLAVTTLAGCVAFGLSPDLWLHPAEAWADRVAWRSTWIQAPHASFLEATPRVVLVLALIGLFSRSAWRGVLVVLLVTPLAVTELAPAWLPADAAIVDALVPLALLAAFGVVVLRDVWMRVIAGGRASATVAGVLVLACLVPSVHSTLDTWPHGAVTRAGGGLGEAQRRGVPGAFDREGTTVWSALTWLNENADQGGDVLFLAVDHLAAGVAPVHLRRDLDLIGHRGALTFTPPPLYVVAPLRPGEHQDIVADARRGAELVHAIQVQGAILLEIWAHHKAPRAHKLARTWREEAPSSLATAERLADELRATDPRSASDLEAWLEGIRQPGPAVLLGVRALLPSVLRPDVDRELQAVLSAGG